LRLRAELDRHQEEQAGLQEQLARSEDESRRFSARYTEVELENSNLANLYVASYRLHGTVKRPEVLTVIQEIVANLIGSEEMAVYELAAGEQTASLVGSFGIDPDRHLTVRVGAGVIGRAILSGDTYVSERGQAGEGLPQEADLSACIPLKLDGRVTGAIALFRLLPQKAAFAAVDRELFDLLATHAATALYCSGLPIPLPTSAAAIA
jgi:GAF domain